MRQDAARNRRAILLATEDLLSRHRPDEVTIEQVAAAAGVGKGTVFHRFGSRMGLMLALMQERAMGLEEQIRAADPATPPRERLLAFLTAVVDVVGRNKGLIAALGQEVASMPKPHDGPAEEHPIYNMWHSHVSTLMAEERPDLDTDLLADLLLASLHSDPILRLLTRGETARLTAALHVLAEGALNS
jgi:AcrR family transcriptional regulator